MILYFTKSPPTYQLQLLFITIDKKEEKPNQLEFLITNLAKEKEFEELQTKLLDLFTAYMKDAPKAMEVKDHFTSI